MTLVFAIVFSPATPAGPFSVAAVETELGPATWHYFYMHDNRKTRNCNSMCNVVANLFMMVFSKTYDRRACFLNYLEMLFLSNKLKKKTFQS